MTESAPESPSSFGDDPDDTTPFGYGARGPQHDPRDPARRDARTEDGGRTNRPSSEAPPRSYTPTHGDIELEDDWDPEDLPEGSPVAIPAEDIDRDMVNQDALRVISRLTRYDYEAFLVGGCVRDLLLGRAPKDFDVATSAHPRHIKRLFRNGRIIGRRFKLVHVVYGDHIIETSTFRGDPQPHASDEDDLLIVEDNVYGTAGEDARRRDFTINGLFLDPIRWRILDYVDGLHDLEQGVLRTIGDPMVRMAEDPVRILRAIKFATRLGFRIHQDTWSAMIATVGDLHRSAPPRVVLEILRLLESGTALGAFRMLRACGALRVLLPEVDTFLGARNDPDPAAHDRADSYWRLLEALDADVHAGRRPTTAVLVAVLYFRIIQREADPATRTLPGAPGDLFSVAGEVLEPMATQTRLARRDWSRARRIIASQRRFTQASNKRFRPLSFMRSEEFPEALELFRLHCSAWGQGWDVYEAWVQRHQRALEAPKEEAEAAPKKSRPSRRRRGGRRRSAD